MSLTNDLASRSAKYWSKSNTFIRRYLSTIRMIAWPSAEVRANDFFRIRRDGLGPTVFFGTSYLFFGWLRIATQRYAPKEIQFEASGLQAALESSLFGINLKYAFVDAVQIAILAIVSSAFYGAAYRKFRFKYFIYAGLYAYGIAAPLFYAAILLLDMLSPYDAANQAVGVLSLPPRLVAEQFAMLLPYEVAAMGGLNVPILEKEHIISIELRHLAYLYIILFPHLYWAIIAAPIMNFLIGNMLPPLGTFLERYSTYSVHGVSMAPTVRSGQKVRLNHRYWERFYINPGSIAAVTITDCIGGAVQVVPTQRKTYQLLNHDLMRSTPSLAICEHPRGWERFNWRYVKALLRFVAAEGQDVKVFKDGRITVDGKAFSDLVSTREISGISEGSEKKYRSNTYMVNVENREIFDLKDHFYVWDCSDCDKTDQTAPDSIKIGVGNLLFMSDYPTYPRFVIISKHAANAKPFFTFEKRW